MSQVQCHSPQCTVQSVHAEYWRFVFDPQLVVPSPLVRCADLAVVRQWKNIGLVRPVEGSIVSDHHSSPLAGGFFASCRGHGGLILPFGAICASRPLCLVAQHKSLLATFLSPFFSFFCSLFVYLAETASFANRLFDRGCPRPGICSAGTSPGLSPTLGLGLPKSHSHAKTTTTVAAAIRFLPQSPASQQQPLCVPPSRLHTRLLVPLSVVSRRISVLLEGQTRFPRPCSAAIIPHPLGHHYRRGYKSSVLRFSSHHHNLQLPDLVSPSAVQSANRWFERGFASTLGAVGGIFVGWESTHGCTRWSQPACRCGPDEAVHAPEVSPASHIIARFINVSMPGFTLVVVLWLLGPLETI